MGELLRALPAVSGTATSSRPTCSWRDGCREPCEEYIPTVLVDGVPTALGRVYRRPYCRRHTDVDFSRRWAQRYRAAASHQDVEALRRLDAEAQRWRERGRTLYGYEP